MDRPNLQEDQLDKVTVVQTPQHQSESKFGAGLRAGAMVGKYELLEEIGSGATSVIYKARDVALHRTVAIKFLLRDELGGADFVTRFKKEARALGTLEHLNIVKVHESNVTTDGVPYIVMNYLNGCNLAETLANEGTPSLGRWLAIMIQACAALEHAHAKGIIHRDIKPSNLVLSQEHNDELVKLIDFGIAKNLADETGLTKTGNAFGSPLYMSPEQCAGAELDERSDIYSLGCVMYEALAGRAPLVGENSLSTMQKHIKDLPERLNMLLSTSFADAAKIASVDSVVMKCLEKKPEDRYQKVSDVKEDLSSLLQGDKPLLRLSLSGQRKQIVTSVLIVLALGIMAFILLQFPITKNIFNGQSATVLESVSGQKSTSTNSATKSLGELNKDKTEEPILEDPFVVAKQTRVFNQLSAQSKMASRNDNVKLAKELATQGLAICAQLGNKPTMVGEARWNKGHAELRLKDYPAAKRDFQLALNAVSTGSDNTSLLWQYHALSGLCKVAAVNQDYEQALKYAGQAYKSIQSRDPNLGGPGSDEQQILKHKSVCMGLIGEVYFVQNKYELSRSYWNAALKFMPGNAEVLKWLKKLPPPR